jgi:hypothetical protein
MADLSSLPRNSFDVDFSTVGPTQRKSSRVKRRAA